MSRSEIWYEEKHSDFLGLRFRVKKVLFSGQSEFQHVDIVETEGHGKMLMNDGLVMVTERDEFVYHDMAAHVPLFVHPLPQSVLVIGGGDGGTVREVIRHPEVKKCTLVEIDRMVVDACREHIPLTSQCLDDPKVDVNFEDGVKFLQQSESEKYDVIIIDSTDPIGPAAPLFGEDFYRSVFSALKTPGVVVSQGESPFYLSDIQMSMLKIQNPIFDRTHIYNFSNLTYPGGLWSFVYASKGDVHPIRDFQQSKYDELDLECRYYNQWIHRASFHLPTFQTEFLKSMLSPIDL